MRENHDNCPHCKTRLPATHRPYYPLCRRCAQRVRRLAEKDLSELAMDDLAGHVLEAEVHR